MTVGSTTPRGVLVYTSRIVREWSPKCGAAPGASCVRKDGKRLKIPSHSPARLHRERADAARRPVAGDPPADFS